MEIQHPFGLRNNRIVHISEIPITNKGKNCGCTCPDCGDALLARLGNKNVRHFAHSSSDCGSTGETALHLFAKEVLTKRLELKVPALYLKYDDEEGLNESKIYYAREVPYFRSYPSVCLEKFIAFDKVITEQNVGTIRPDIIAYVGERRLFIEIAVTHEIDEVKLSRIMEIKEATIEIYFNIKKLGNTGFNRAKLEELLINGIENKTWIYNPLAEKMKAEILLKRKIFDENKIEREKRQVGINLQRDIFFDMLTGVTANEAKTKHEIALTAFREYEAKLKTRKIPDIIKLDVPGDSAFNCYRPAWQYKVLKTFIAGHLGESITENKLVYWLVHDDAIPTWSIQRNKEDMTLVFGHYLGKLVSLNILKRQISDEFKDFECRIIFDDIDSLYGLTEKEITEKVASAVSAHTNRILSD